MSFAKKKKNPNLPDRKWATPFPRTFGKSEITDHGIKNVLDAMVSKPTNTVNVKEKV